MSQKVTPFMGGLGIDATSKFEIQSNATVTVGDGTTTGNVVIGGKVGIGTSSPSTALDVTGTVTADGLTVDGTALMSTTNELQFFTSAYGIRASTGLEIKTGDFTRFLEGTTEHLRIASGGNVGIGTPSPSTTLDVAGNVSLGTNSSNTITLTGSIDLGTL